MLFENGIEGPLSDNLTIRPPSELEFLEYLAADKIEDAVSCGDSVDVIGLVPCAVVHPHQHVPLRVAVAAIGVNAVKVGKM